MKERIPPEVREILRTLEASGHEAWCVGGCVRDLLRGGTPQDWDLATSARPEETMALFAPQAYPTGLRHGTVTVRRVRRGAVAARRGAMRVEVTTFRRDGPYADHRHPDAVAFSDTLEEDLSRRDFTVNAMALRADGALRDPFGGRADLAAARLRCVGCARDRFEEDALRILRALRFASTLGFSLEPETDAALRQKRELLRAVAPERIREEFCALLCGGEAAAVLRGYPEVIGVFLPEILPAVGFDQKNPHHCFDVWEHTLRAVAAGPPEAEVRMALVLHDLGKPACFTVDGAGIGHFYGHPRMSRAIGEEVLRRLRFSAAQQEVILTLVERHDCGFPVSKTGVRRALRALGKENLRRLLAVKRADNLAQAPECRGVQVRLDRFSALLEQLLAQDVCFSLRQLAVNGRDLLALGLRGPAVGRTLAALLDAVVEGRLPNERAALLEEAVRAQETERR